MSNRRNISEFRRLVEERGNVDFLTEEDWQHLRSLHVQKVMERVGEEEMENGEAVVPVFEIPSFLRSLPSTERVERTHLLCLLWAFLLNDGTIEVRNGPEWMVKRTLEGVVNGVPIRRTMLLWVNFEKISTTLVEMDQSGGMRIVSF